MTSEIVNNYISIRLVKFYMQLIGMWPTKNRTEFLVSNFALVLTVFSMAFSAIVQGMQLYNNTNDIVDFSFCVPEATVVFSECGQLILFICIRKEVTEFISYTKKIFWKVEYSGEGLLVVNMCNKICFTSCFLLSILVQLITSQYVFLPILEIRGKNVTERTLPFKLWFNWPVWKSPLYEILYLLQAMGTYSLGICFIAFSIFLFTINVFTAGQFRILQTNLQEVCNILQNDKSQNSVDNSYKKLNECVSLHQSLIKYTEDVENLYCYCILGKIFGIVVQTCFTGVQILLGATTTFTRTVVSMEYIFGCFLQLYFFTWSSHQIINESEEVSQAAYRCKWYSLPYDEKGKAFRQSLEILMLRARRPCVLSVGKFCPLSLNTFTAVLRTSMSYFTVLRETIQI